MIMMKKHSTSPSRNMRPTTGILCLLCFFSLPALRWVFSVSIPANKNDSNLLLVPAAAPSSRDNVIRSLMASNNGINLLVLPTATPSSPINTVRSLSPLARLAATPSSPINEVRPLSPLARLQAASYRNGAGLILNLHMTHHGGTSFCGAVGNSPDAGNSPSFACWLVQDEDNVSGDYPHENPWKYEDTAHNIAIARGFFHMISWEFNSPPSSPSIAETNWEDPNLFSVIVMRDPMKRMIAGDGFVVQAFPGVIQGTASNTTLDRFARSNYSNNFALKVLAGIGCCDGKHTDRQHLEAAKALVRRFSVVIDIECLSESLQLLAVNEWNITLGKIGKGRTRSSPRERIGNEDIYEYLEEKNKLDIELYEWSKSLSYLDCSQVLRAQEEALRLERRS
jgi:hypothetical protein